MHWSLLDSTAVILLTLHALLKGMETRLVLLSSGCSLALIAGEPLAAFRAFDRSMTLGASSSASARRWAASGILRTSSSARLPERACSFSPRARRMVLGAPGDERPQGLSPARPFSLFSLRSAF